jgi:cytidyltransferase-like protein
MLDAHTPSMLGRLTALVGHPWPDGPEFRVAAKVLSSGLPNGVLPVNNGERDSDSTASSAALRISIVSGYFNPLHVGHIRMMKAAAELAERLVVIVNNDEQQMMKKGRIITPLDDRLEIVRALRIVDEAVPAIDEDATVKQTLASLRERYPSASLTFANGGDRSATSVIAEAELCEALGIGLQLGVGGTEKADSSSRINAALGIQ